MTLEVTVIGISMNQSILNSKNDKTDSSNTEF